MEPFSEPIWELRICPICEEKLFCIKGTVAEDSLKDICKGIHAKDVANDTERNPLFIAAG